MAKTIFEEMGGTYTQVGDYLLLICQYKCNSYFKNFLMTSAGERKPKRFLGRLLISSTTLAS